MIKKFVLTLIILTSLVFADKLNSYKIETFDYLTAYSITWEGHVYLVVRNNEGGISIIHAAHCIEKDNQKETPKPKEVKKYEYNW